MLLPEVGEPEQCGSAHTRLAVAGAGFRRPHCRSGRHGPRRLTTRSSTFRSGLPATAADRRPRRDQIRWTQPPVVPPGRIGTVLRFPGVQRRREHPSCHQGHSSRAWASCHGALPSCTQAVGVDLIGLTLIRRSAYPCVARTMLGLRRSARGVPSLGLFRWRNARHVAPAVGSRADFVPQPIRPPLDRSASRCRNRSIPRHRG
jgi:hypothetical protein